MMPKIEERLTIWASRWLRQMRQERAGRAHHAPEIDVDQPFHLRLVDLGELAEQRHAGIVDDDVEAGMGGDRGLREGLDLARARRRRRGATLTLRGPLAPWRSRRRPPAVRPRRDRPARDRSRARRARAPAPGRCHWRRRSRRRRLHGSQSSYVKLHVGKISRGNPYTAGRLWQPGACRAVQSSLAAASLAVMAAVRGTAYGRESADVALVPPDLADRGRLARHRRALYAGGGADARDRGPASPRRSAARSGSFRRCSPPCSGLPRCCTPARWRSRR